MSRGGFCNLIRICTDCFSGCYLTGSTTKKQSAHLQDDVNKIHPRTLQHTHPKGDVLNIAGQLLQSRLNLHRLLFRVLPYR